LLALQGIHKALVPGGKFAMVEMFVSSFIRNNVGNMEASAMYSMGTILCGGSERPEQADSEAALGKCMGKEKAVDLCTQAGFKVVGISPLNKDGGAEGVFMCDKF
jgi:hypothetical protein